MSRWIGIMISAMLLIASRSAAYYTPPAFHQLAAGSDLVVLGNIESVSESTFVLAIEEVLVGTAPGTHLEVARFKDWTCSQRWLPYAVGQREIAFLCKKEHGYRTNSGGAEGEWQIIGSRVTCAYLRAEYSHPEIFPLDPVQPLESVTSAIRDFGACIRIDNESFSRGERGPGSKPSYEEKVVELCDAATIDSLAKRSKVHRYLVETLRAWQEKPFGLIYCGRSHGVTR